MNGDVAGQAGDIGDGASKLMSTAVFYARYVTGRIGIVVNHRGKSFANFDHGEGWIS